MVSVVSWIVDLLLIEQWSTIQTPTIVMSTDSLCVLCGENGPNTVSKCGCSLHEDCYDEWAEDKSKGDLCPQCKEQLVVPSKRWMVITTATSLTIVACLVLGLIGYIWTIVRLE